MTLDPEKLLSMLPNWAAGNPRIAELLREKQYPAVALEQYGMERFQASDTSMAVKAFSAAAALRPDHAIYHNNLGVALDAQKDFSGAVESFRASLALQQDQPQIWLNIAYSLKRLGRMEEAEEALATAASHATTSAEAFMALGSIELERADYTEAMEYLRHAIEAGGRNATLHATLGATLFQLGQPHEALTEYATAATLDPNEIGYKENADFLTMLTGVIDGEAEPAVTAFAKPLTDDNVLLSAFNRALNFLASFEKRDAAKALVEEWAQYYPDDEDMLYFRQVYAGKPLVRAPNSYLAHHFDRVAGQIDASFLRSIDYRVPEHMGKMLTDAGGTEWRGHVLDAGCGNGLLGRVLKPFARSLIGVDLSPLMVDLADASGLYDSVIKEDMLAFMGGQRGRFDLIAAADSLIYFGALEGVFAAAHGALKPGGLFMFSLETSEDTRKFMVIANGRFKHARSYVMAAGKEGFRAMRDTDVMLRRQVGKPVDGTIFLFQKV